MRSNAAKINLRPWMAARDVHLIEERLLASRLSTVNVLEWGSGGSTMYFPSVLGSNGINYRWLSIEYNTLWYSHVTALTQHDPNIRVMLFSVENHELKQRKTEMENYIKYPASLCEKFDFIIIDGRKRRRCLLEAAGLLNNGGAVLLHDAERTYYHCALSSFTHSKFLSPKLWMGTL